jgi:protein involved in polysaccharide export with SLBB domain
LTVTPEGYLLIPAVGAVEVKNSTLTEARARAVGLAGRKYTNAVITLTLVNPRKLSFEISGQVMNEGMQEAYSVQRVSTLIEQANTLPATQITKKFYDQDKQALRRAASQRYIMVRHRDGSSQRVDLVRYMITGAGTQNPYLREGDFVFVPSRSDQDNLIGVYGRVTRNITCEYVDGDSVTDLVQLGLGPLPRALPEAATLARQSLNGAFMDTLHVDLRAIAERRMPNIRLQPGDRLVIPEAREERTGSFVSVEGEVTHAGKYPITRESTRLSDVIRAAGGFTNEAYLPGSALLRSNGPASDVQQGFDEERLLIGRTSLPSDSLYFLTETELRLKGEVVSVNFPRLFVSGDSTEDVTLRNYDRIIVPARTLTVYVFGQVTQPGHIPYVEGKRARYYIDLAGGYTEEARSGDVKVIKRTTRNWLDPSETTIQDGDYIFVPKEVHYPFAYYLTTITQAAGIIASLATVILVVRNLK